MLAGLKSSLPHWKKFGMHADTICVLFLGKLEYKGRWSFLLGTSFLGYD
jgi:hypothetical protein